MFRLALALSIFYARLLGLWTRRIRNFPEPDLNEAGRAADAAREVNGAMVACWLR